ncbi:hypothetical protein acdb102_05980 [Acidothermaceae bacterium B102]|nr:hypothetical protein acdb102_05980 [Acidothermaceae bacterium B102]
MTLRVRRLALVAGTSLTTGVLAVTSALTSTGAGTAWTAARPSAHLRSVIVQAQPGQARAVAAAVRASGGHIDRTLSIVNGFAAHVSPAEAAALSRSAAVRAVTPNATLTSASSSYDPTVPGASYAGSVRAPSIWGIGDTGAGVGVALLDTGVSIVPDLVGHVAAGVDFSGEGNSLLDSFGHGTVMAGLIAGSGVASGGQYPGVAPGATITSVKVAGRNGVTDVSQVLAGLQWIGTFGPAKGIRVAALAWGTPSNQSPLVDPLDFAVERLWGLGITVVTSAGNQGPSSGTITKPGDDPAVITVGAYDDLGTQDNSDDAMVGFSSRGPTANNAAKPDLVAPGRTLIATRSPDSLIEAQNPQALVDGGYIRGSGTSEATAVTTGGVALLLAKHPSWTPDKIKYALTSTAKLLNGTSSATALAAGEGAGELRLNRAVYAYVGSAPTQALSATGLGSIEASRGGLHVLAACAGSTDLTLIEGEIDVSCQAWDGDQWSGDQWSGDQWSGDQWSGDQWSGDQWSGDQWSGDQWSGDQWSGDQWSGDQWSSQSWDAAPTGARGRAWRH